MWVAHDIQDMLANGGAVGDPVLQKTCRHPLSHHLFLALVRYLA
jgi:hypothetical protein